MRIFYFYSVLKKALNVNSDGGDVKFDWRFYIDRINDLQHRNSCIAVSLRQRLDRAKVVPVLDLTSKYFVGGSIPGASFDLKHFRKMRDDFVSRCLVYQEKLNRVLISLTRAAETCGNLVLKRSEERNEKAYFVKDLREEINVQFQEIQSKRTQLSAIKVLYDKEFGSLLELHSKFDNLVVPGDGMRKNMCKLLAEHKDFTGKEVFMKKQLHLFEVRLRATRRELVRTRKALCVNNNGVIRAVTAAVPVEIGFVERFNRGKSFVGKSGDAYENLTLCERNFLFDLFSEQSPLWSKLCSSISDSLPEISARKSQLFSIIGREFWANWKDAQLMFGLSEALLHMSTLTDIDKAVQYVMRAVCKLTECDRASYWVIDKAKGIAWTKVNNFTGPDNEMTTLMVPINSGLVGAAFKSGQVLNIADAYGDPRFNRQVDARTDYRTRSVLCYPIVYQGQVVGVCQCINKISPSNLQFTECDLAIVKALGNAMLNVLSSCHAHEEEVKQNLRRFAFVDAIDEMLSKMHHRRDLLSLLNVHFRKLFKCDECSVVLVYRDFYSRISLVDSGQNISMTDADRDSGIVHDCVEKRVPVHLFGRANLTNFSATLGKADSDLLKTGILDSNTTGMSEISVHTWPLVSESRFGEVSAVVQWVCLERSVIGFGDDGTFNELNPIHVDLVHRFMEKIGYFVEKFWPSKYRLVWTKAKHLQLKVRGLVAFSFLNSGHPRPHSRVEIKDAQIRNAPPPKTRRWIDLWARGKEWALSRISGAAPIAPEDPKDTPLVRKSSNFYQQLQNEQESIVMRRKSLTIQSSTREEIETVANATWFQRKSVLLQSDLSALILRVGSNNSISSISSSSSGSIDDKNLNNSPHSRKSSSVDAHEAHAGVAWETDHVEYVSDAQVGIVELPLPRALEMPEAPSVGPSSDLVQPHAFENPEAPSDGSGLELLQLHALEVHEAPPDGTNLDLLPGHALKDPEASSDGSNLELLQSRGLEVHEAFSEESSLDLVPPRVFEVLANQPEGSSLVVQAREGELSQPNTPDLAATLSDREVSAYFSPLGDPDVPDEPLAGDIHGRIVW